MNNNAENGDGGGSSGNGGASANANNNPKASTDAAQNTSSIPQEADNKLDYLEQKGSPPEGYKGGSKFNHEPLPGAQKFPKVDENGKPINYKEYDADPKIPGPRRNKERIITGDDGSAYYTNDHYHTFNKMRGHNIRK